LQYLSGYKPRGNFQEALAEAVAVYLSDHSGFYESLLSATPPPPIVESSLPDLRIEEIETAPPPPSRAKSKQSGPGSGAKTDWGQLDSQNRKLGALGEHLVLELERRHLKENGHSDLAAKVEWVSKERGDGDGYDILSFDAAGQPKYIEVKTTKSGWGSAFFISSNEVQAAQQLGESYWLYRLYSFGPGPKLYRMQGPLGEKLDLEPKVYAARVGIGSKE
jgi:hypothetical protein